MHEHNLTTWIDGEVLAEPSKVYKLNVYRSALIAEFASSPGTIKEDAMAALDSVVAKQGSDHAHICEITASAPTESVVFARWPKVEVLVL